ncbi:MAG TPA: Fe-S cluster assembly protein SufD [Candidatus Obscuribacterales bacterium]
MADSKSTNTITKERVDELAAKNAEPAWLKEERLSAWEAYLKAPTPCARDENWRRTEIDALDLSRLSTVDFAKEIGKQAPSPPRLERMLKAIGKEVPHIYSSPEGAFLSGPAQALKEQNVVLSTISTALEKHPQLIKPFLTAKGLKEKSFGEDISADKFQLMNRSLFNCGVFLHVPADVSLLLPVVSLLTVGEEDQFAAFPRVVVVVGERSKVSFVNAIASSRSAKGKSKNNAPLSLVDTATEVYIGKNAQLTYIDLQDFNANVFAVSRTYNEVQQDGNLYSLTVGLGGGQLKSDIHTTLSARGASSDTYGIVLGAGHEHFSFNTIQDHIAPDTRSTINFRVALKESASSVYLGTIRVAKEAQKTDSYQSNRNLLLGQEARADSIPKLEILADDVKCSHGATVGPADREQIFYLMSRGLSALEAEELVVSGFFRQIIESCPQEGIRAWIDELIIDKIHGTP